MIVRALLRKREVAQLLGVSDRTIERWMQREGLPHMKPFGKKGPVRYDAAAVERWWSARCELDLPADPVLALVPVEWSALDWPERDAVLGVVVAAVLGDGMSQADARRAVEAGDLGGRAVTGVPASAVTSALKVARAVGSLGSEREREAG